jgi:hypothetical protein
MKILLMSKRHELRAPIALLLLSLVFLSNSDLYAQYSPEIYHEAHEGATACAALAYSKTGSPGPLLERWTNRGLALGMIAANFYELSTGESLSWGEFLERRDGYYSAIQKLTKEEKARLEAECEPRYREIDKLCASDGTCFEFFHSD